MRHTLTVVVVIAAAVLLSGCDPFGSGGGKNESTPTTLSGSAVEKTINSKIPPQFPNYQVGPAHCPKTLDPSGDSPVECSITVDGQPAKVDVTRDGDNTSSYQVATSQAIVDISKLEINIEHQAKGKVTNVDCGVAAVRVFDPPGKLECTARKPTAKGVKNTTLDVTIQDKDGNYSFEEAEDN